MVRPTRPTEPDEPRDAATPADETDSTPGQAFARALERLPRREAPAPAPPDGAPSPDPALRTPNGNGNGNGHSPGAPPKLTSPDQISAPRLEASLKKLLNSTSSAGRNGRGEASNKRNRTLPPPPRADRKTQQRSPAGTRSPAKVTRVVVPRPPTETRDIKKLPPLKPTRLLKPPGSKPPVAAPPAAAPPAAAPPAATPPAATPPAEAPAEAAAAAAAAGIAAALGDLETSKKRRPQPPAPASPVAPAVPGEATSEFENLLEGLLESRESAAAIPTEPTPPAHSPQAAASGPGDETGGFSVDVQIFPAHGGGNEGNLSDFVSKILDEMDSIVDAPAGPPGSDDEPPPVSRETGEFEEGFGGVTPAPAPPPNDPTTSRTTPSSDTRRSRETGEFEDSASGGPAISPDELSALSDLFNED